MKVFRLARAHSFVLVNIQVTNIFQLFRSKTGTQWLAYCWTSCLQSHQMLSLWSLWVIWVNIWQTQRIWSLADFCCMQQSRVSEWIYFHDICICDPYIFFPPFILLLQTTNSLYVSLCSYCIFYPFSFVSREWKWGKGTQHSETFT